MISALDEAMNDLLWHWHEWATTFPVGLGYPTETTFSRKGRRTSRQYDDVNGAFEQDEHNARMEAVDAAIDAVPQPWRTALWFNARNLYTGACVWRSPRLPDDEMARAELVVEARERLAGELDTRGVLTLAEGGTCE